MNTPGVDPWGKEIFSNINRMSLSCYSNPHKFKEDGLLKIIVCSQKSVKRLPGVQNDSSRLRIRITPRILEKNRNPF
jgi:hypothetical protein